MLCFFRRRDPGEGGARSDLNQSLHNAAPSAGCWQLGRADIFSLSLDKFIISSEFSAWQARRF
jgi:hypothetical protein